MKARPNARGCLEWSASVRPDGYAATTIAGVRMYAHRAAWLLCWGAPSPGMVIMHVCDNRRCVNIEHLRLGTQKENMRDMAAKGRHGKRSRAGEANGYAKLTAGDVARIRASYAQGALQRDLAAQFGVSQGHISEIVRRKIWNQGGRQ